jgi:hypothetical protein
LHFGNPLRASILPGEIANGFTWFTRFYLLFRKPSLGMQQWTKSIAVQHLAARESESEGVFWCLGELHPSTFPERSESGRHTATRGGNTHQQSDGARGQRAPAGITPRAGRPNEEQRAGEPSNGSTDRQASGRGQRAEIQRCAADWQRIDFSRDPAREHITQTSLGRLERLRGKHQVLPTLLLQSPSKKAAGYEGAYDDQSEKCNGEGDPTLTYPAD